MLFSYSGCSDKILHTNHVNITYTHRAGATTTTRTHAERRCQFVQTSGIQPFLYNRPPTGTLPENHPLPIIIFALSENRIWFGK